MKAVIPCAKKKEDMFPFSETKPTALMPVMDRPIVKHLIKQLQSVGVDEIYLVTNHLEEQFEDFFSEYTNVNVVHQEELEGTGAAVETCDFIEEDFFVVNGDVMVSENDLANLKESHERGSSSVTLLAAKGDQPEKFGVLSITNDRVNSLEEKPEKPDNALVNTGIYLFTPEVFSTLGELEDEKSLTDAVRSMVDEDGARFELIEDYWMDIGDPKKLWKADRLKRDEIDETSIHDEAEVHESAEITGEAVIDEGAVLKQGAVLEGKVYLGKNAVVGPNSVVRDSTVSRDSAIRNASVEDALLFDENIVDPHVHLENCIIGEESDIKSGTVIRESFIGARSFIEMNNSIYGTKFVPDARTDLSELSK
ncbi:MAG: sugar phosphate nucleotidyltransferase [Candidatus Nanohaloarchaea archaeon]